MWVQKIIVTLQTKKKKNQLEALGPIEMSSVQKVAACFLSCSRFPSDSTCVTGIIQTLLNKVTQRFVCTVF